MIVSPPITVVLAPVGASARDTLVVSTQYAHVGNVVALQVQAANGSWLYLRSNRPLDASGQTSFLLSGTRLRNREVRVVLLATVRHGAAVSSAVSCRRRADQLVRTRPSRGCSSGWDLR